jgi:hypothetical protein
MGIFWCSFGACLCSGFGEALIGKGLLMLLRGEVLSGVGGSFRAWWFIQGLVVHSGLGGSFRAWWFIQGLVFAFHL